MDGSLSSKKERKVTIEIQDIFRINRPEVEKDRNICLWTMKEFKKYVKSYKSIR